MFETLIKEMWNPATIFGILAIAVFAPLPVHLAIAARRTRARIRAAEAKSAAGDVWGAWMMVQEHWYDLSKEQKSIYDRLAVDALNSRFTSTLSAIETDGNSLPAFAMLRELGYRGDEYTLTGDRAEGFRVLGLFVDPGPDPAVFFRKANAVKNQDAKFVLMEFGRRYYWQGLFNNEEPRKDQDYTVADLDLVFPRLGWLDTPEQQRAFIGTLTPTGRVRAAKELLGSASVASYAQDALVTSRNNPQVYLATIDAVIRAGADVEDIRDDVEACWRLSMHCRSYGDAERIAGTLLKEAGRVREVRDVWHAARVLPEGDPATLRDWQYA